MPDKVGRFVLDGAVAPHVSIEEQTKVKAAALDQALANLVNCCHKENNCLPPNHTISSFFTDLIYKVIQTPFTVGDRQIIEGFVVIGTASNLYDDVSGWPSLHTALAKALTGNGRTFVQMADVYSGRKNDGTYQNNENDANINIDGLDLQRSKTNNQI